MYPHCAAKNILVPYPNPDGRWYNGALDRDVERLLKTTPAGTGTGAGTGTAMLASERELSRKYDKYYDHDNITNSSSSSSSVNDSNDDDNVKWNIWTYPRPAAQFYQGGNHGSCKALRAAIQHNYKTCTESSSSRLLHNNDHGHAMRMSTFCPCPGGDSPGAKRVFDAVLAGCIPIILSEDFVWPFSTDTEIDAAQYTLSEHTATAIATEGAIASHRNDRPHGGEAQTWNIDPSEFSVRLKAEDYETKLTPPSCKVPSHPDGTTPVKILQDTIESKFSAQDIERLRVKGILGKAVDLYSWYRRRRDLPDNPLKEGVLPDGGTAHRLVRALEERAGGVLWPRCRQELMDINRRKQEQAGEENGRGKWWEVEDNVRQFKC